MPITLTRLPLCSDLRARRSQATPAFWRAPQADCTPVAHRLTTADRHHTYGISYITILDFPGVPSRIEALTPVVAPLAGT